MYRIKMSRLLNLCIHISNVMSLNLGKPIVTKISQLMWYIET